MWPDLGKPTFWVQTNFWENSIKNLYESSFFLHTWIKQLLNLLDVKFHTKSLFSWEIWMIISDWPMCLKGRFSKIRSHIIIVGGNKASHHLTRWWVNQKLYNKNQSAEISIRGQDILIEQSPNYCNRTFSRNIKVGICLNLSSPT